MINESDVKFVHVLVRQPSFDANPRRVPIGTIGIYPRPKFVDATRATQVKVVAALVKRDSGDEFKRDRGRRIVLGRLACPRGQMMSIQATEEAVSELLDYLQSAREQPRSERQVRKRLNAFFGVGTNPVSKVTSNRDGSDW